MEQDYEHFRVETDPLIKGLKPRLLVRADAAREDSGIAYALTSGLRTPEQNAKDPNAVKDSAHLKGEALDADCQTETELFLMLFGMIRYFNRIGIYVRRDPDNPRRLIPTHLHTDVDKTKTQKVIWIELEG